MKTTYRLIAFLFLMMPFTVSAQSTFAEKPKSHDTKKLNLSAILDNNQLFITGNFESSKHYEVLMFDANGYKIYSQSFSGEGTEQRFDISGKLSSGKYTVAVRLKNSVDRNATVSML